MAHGDHRLGYLEEARDVCAYDVVAWLSKVLSSRVCCVVDVHHDSMELLVYLFTAPK